MTEHDKGSTGDFGSSSVMGHKSWFTESGPDYDVVISSRVRLSRNLAGFPFPGHMSAAEGRAVTTGIVQIFQDRFSSREYLAVDPSRLHAWSKLLLLERNLVADEFPDDVNSALVLRSDERFVASVNMVDHLRLAVLRGGKQLTEGYGEVERIDKVIEEVLPYAVSLEWGYLNTEITNIGTGMRASVLLHLPALMETDAAPEVFDTLARSGFMVKGFWVSDEETKARRSLGNMYQVANMITIGVKETEIIEKLEKATHQLVNYEKKARQELMRRDGRDKTSRRVEQSREHLLAATRLSYREAVESLSDIRLGVALGIADRLTLEQITSMIFTSQRSHVLHARTGYDVSIEQDAGEAGNLDLDQAVIDERRAMMVRRFMSAA